MAKLQEKVESESPVCASRRGFLVPLCLGSGCCHRCTRGCTTQASLLLASHGLLGTKSSSAVRQRVPFSPRCVLWSPRPTQRLRNAPYHPMHDGWLPCATRFSIAHQITSKLPISRCAHHSAKSNMVGHERCKPLADFPSPRFLLQLQGGPLQHQKSKLRGRLPLGWPRQDGLMVAGAFPSRQPDGSNESAAGGLVKGIPPL